MAFHPPQDDSPVTQTDRLPTALVALSARELEVLRLASSGSTNGEIGQCLSLSVHAVKFHLASIYRKLGVANRTEAAVALVAASHRHVAATEPKSA